MNKKITLLVVGTFLITAFINVGSAEKTKDKDFNQLEIHRVFSNIKMEQEENNTEIKLSETNSYIMRNGRPVLPCYEKTFIFPIDTEIKNVEVEKKNVEKIFLKGEIKTAPYPQNANIVNTKKSDLKELDLTGFFPQKNFDYNLGRGINDNEKSIFLKVTVYPVRYSYEDKTVEWAKNIDIKIEYEKSSESFTNSNQYKFLILTRDYFVDNLNVLVTHKNNRGISTKLVTLDEIYEGDYFQVTGRDNCEKIKYFIKNAYDNWGITDVLLVGGNGYFPSRQAHVAIKNDGGDVIDNEIFLSDLYYADLYDSQNNFLSWDTNDNNVFAEYDWNGNFDEMDLYPDVRVGRLACNKNSEVETVVEKIITYETNEAWAQDWFNNIVVIGGDTFPNENKMGKDIDEGEFVNQKILDIMYGFKPEKIWSSNGRLKGWNPSGVESINNALNSGCGFVDWSGHGSPEVWTTYPHNGRTQSLPSPFPPGNYYNSYISNLKNGDKLPIAINGGCSLGKYNANNNCFAWSYLSNQDGGGIASCGCTGLGWVYSGNYSTTGLVEGMAVDMFQAYRDGSLTFGEMWSDAINEYIYSFMSSHDYKTILEWQPFGDPTLKIQNESQPPLKPETPSGESNGEINKEYNYSTATTDPDNDDIYYRFDWDDGTYSEWYGPFRSGEICEDVKKTWDSKGKYQVRVQAKDEHGKISEWSDSKPVEMPVNKDSFGFFWFYNLLEKIPLLKIFFDIFQKMIN